MKPKSTFRLAFPLASSIASLLAASPILAASLYWDIDGDISGAGGIAPAGAWTSGGTTWSTSANGTDATTASTTASTDDLFFSAGINATGAYTIDLTSAQDAKSLTFQDGTATISGTGGVINLGGTGIINVTNSLLVSPNSAVIGANTNTVLGGTAGLIKTGVGTLTLNGTDANTFTGGLAVNGGTLSLSLANMATPTNLIDGSNTLGLGGGTLSITGNATGTTSQTFGDVTINSGGSSLLVNPNGGTDSLITLGSLTSTASGGSFVVGRATSSGAGTLSITTTTDKDALGIYGGRVVFANGTANTGYDWATTATSSPGPYELSSYTGYTALDTTTVGAVTDTNNSRITAGATLPAASNRTTNSLKFENPAANGTFDILAGNTLTLTSGGLLMTGANNNININNGSITAGDGTSPADLVVHQFNPAQPLSVGLTGGTLGNTPEISSNIVNNNGQPVTLVKNGPGSIRFTGASNTFTGGVVVNQGSVDFGNLSLNNNPITFNANAFLYTNGAHTTSGAITLNNGSQVTVCNNNSSFTVNANVVGNGGLSAANGGQGAMTLTLNGTGNTFTGPLRFTHSNGTQLCAINVASLPDTDTIGMGNITFGGGTVSSTSQNFSLVNAAVAPVTLANRHFEMAGANVNHQINNASTQALTIQSDLLVTGSQAKNLQLGGTGSGGGTFAGVIANHASPTAPGTVPNALRKTAATNNTLTLASVEGISVGATITGAALSAGTTITAINPFTREVTLSTTFAGGNNSTYNVGVLFTVANVVNSVSVTKAGTGTWVLSGNNSYSGPTLVSQGVLNLQHANALGATTTGTLVTSGAALQIQGGITVGNEALTLNGTGISTNGALRNLSGDNTYEGLVTLGSLSRIQTDAGSSLTLSNTGTITGPGFGLTVGGAGNTTINSIIGTTTGALLKQGSGTLTLDHANTYTGATTVSDGTLALGASGSITTSASMTIGATGTLDTTAQSTYAIPAAQPLSLGIDATGTGSSGKIVAANLDITSAAVTYNITGTPDDPVYVLATYSGTLAGAAFASVPAAPTGYALDYAFEGNKIALVVATGPTFASWIAGFGLTGPDALATADPDFDGISNSAEMVLGGNPATGMDTALLPTIERVNADPDNDTTLADYLLFTYRRSDLSVTAGVTADCETDADLVAPWTAATGAPGVVILVDDHFTFTPAAAANTDRVRVYVPRGANTKLFGRLRVVVP
jgi:fibronectin-binding autotransporter adhesin